MWKFLNPLYFRKTGTENDIVLENIDNILEKASKDSMLAKDELSILTATGEYLDEWGSWFGMRRADGEDDEQYRRRILSVMSNPKSTIPAIEGTIRRYFNNPDMYVKVYEPHKNIKIFNISTFSGPDKFQSGDYWRHSVIDIHLKDVFIDEHLKSSIKDVKSAGIGVYYTNYLQFNEGKILVLSEGYNVSTERKLIISPEVITGDSLLFSSRLNEGKFISGSRETYSGKLTSTELSEVSLPFNTNKIITTRNSLFYPGRSTTAFRSGLSQTERYNGSLSGYKLSPYDLENPLPWVDSVIVFDNVQEKLTIFSVPPGSLQTYGVESTVLLISHRDFEPGVSTNYSTIYHLGEVAYNSLRHISRLFDYTVDSLGYMTLDELMDEMVGYNIIIETEVKTNLTANMSTLENPSHEIVTTNQFETSVKPNSDYNVELVESQVSIENIRLSGQKINASSLLVINDIKDMTVDELANLNYVPLYVGEFEVTTTTV